MESEYNSIKQRNPKYQRGRRRTQEKGNENINHTKQGESNDTPAPQPQRANRRQRNEISTASNSSQPTTKPAAAVTTSVPETKECPADQNSVPVDFSNLKRETEEIAKLTKKFSKREISSNWHRYSVPEGPKQDKTADEDAPADFTDLLHVSLAGGGHLQLKEEKDWSSATGSELGGYFALDLHVLSQGLSCTPAYEQLRLPKHLLSDDEVKKFDTQAEQAKGLYSSVLVEDGKNKKIRSKEILTKTLTSTEGSGNNLEVHEIKNNFNILDLEKATQQLIDLETEPCQYTSTANDINRRTSLSKTRDIKQDITLNIENLDTTDTCEITNFNKALSNNNNQSLSIDSEINFDENNSEQLINFETVSKSNVDSEKSITENEKRIEKDIHVSEKELKIEIPVSTKEFLQNNVSLENSQLTGSKNKKTNKERKSPGRDLYINKVPLESKNIKPTLEDDDDLEFLLSLKKPVDQQPVKDSKPPPLKESSHVPGIAKDSKPTEPKHSELDDWLDSVLED